MKSKKDISTEYLLPIDFWIAFLIHVLILAVLFFSSLSFLYALTLSGGYVSAVLDEIMPEEAVVFRNAFSTSFCYHGSSIELYTHDKTELSCSGIVSFTGKDGSVCMQKGASIHLESGKVKFQSTQNESDNLQNADYSIQYLPPNNHTEYTLFKKFNENLIFMVKSNNSTLFEPSAKYVSWLHCNKPITLSLTFASILDDFGNKIPIDSCTIIPSHDDGVYISLLQNNRLSGNYSFYMPLSGTLDMIIDYADSVHVCGSGTLYYSDTASEKEYTLHRRDLVCRNDFFDGFNTIFNRSEATLSEQMNVGHYNIQYSYTSETERLFFDGEADYVSISGYNIILHSPFDWIRDNPYLLPSAILTVFGGAISLTLSDKNKKVNSLTSNRKPINRANTKRRMLYMIRSLRRK